MSYRTFIPVVSSSFQKDTIMARATMPVGISLNLTSSNRTKTEKNPEQGLSTGSSAAAGIVFGLLCSLIVWLFLAYGIYRIHEMFIPIR
jgi:hypothetical protein